MQRSWSSSTRWSSPKDYPSRRRWVDHTSAAHMLLQRGLRHVYKCLMIFVHKKYIKIPIFWQTWLQFAQNFTLNIRDLSPRHISARAPGGKSPKSSTSWQASPTLAIWRSSKLGNNMRIQKISDSEGCCTTFWTEKTCVVEDTLWCLNLKTTQWILWCVAIPALYLTLGSLDQFGMDTIHGQESHRPSDSQLQAFSSPCGADGSYIKGVKYIWVLPKALKPVKSWVGWAGSSCTLPSSGFAAKPCGQPHMFEKHHQDPKRDPMLHQ